MAQPNTSQLYVCELSNGFIKVGRSKKNAESRLRAHAAIARLMGEEPRRSVIYECKTRSNKHESMLIKQCLDHGGKNISKEWFVGISFEKASQLALECASIEFEKNGTEAEKEIKLGVLDEIFPGKDHEWLIALRHAKTIQEIFTENLVWSDNFNVVDSLGISRFEIFCAISVYKNVEIPSFYLRAIESLNCRDFRFCDEVIAEGKKIALNILMGLER